MTDELGSVPESPSCPDCDGPMTKRVNKNNSPFWGCNRYPECQGLIDASGEMYGYKALSEGSVVAPPKVDDFRRQAALKILCTLLEHPENRKYLWDQYLLNASPSKLAVELATDLCSELGKVQ